MRLTLPDLGVQSTIELDDGPAPRTSAAIESLLPSRGVTIHSRRSGQEIFMVLPAAELPDGVFTRELAPGDVIVEAFPAYYQDAPPERIHERARPYTHLGIVYGAETQFATPQGYVPVRRIGRVTSDLGELAAACAEIRMHGIRPYVLERLNR